MKTIINFRNALCVMLIGSTAAMAQQPAIDNFRPNDKRGINMFETPKADSVTYEGVKVRIGGDFAMQFQGLTQSNDATYFGNQLAELGSNLNLPNANLNLDVQLLDGVRMHMRTYLSARHHNEAWIKGGYMQIDNLDFIQPGFLSGVMDYTSVRIGMDEFNYGDAHFRRTDNAMALYNPFVGNYIMDAFSTEAFAEVTVQNNGLIAVAGITNGKLNQNVVVTPTTDNKLSLYGKLGYDKQWNEDLRTRITGSIYVNNGASTGTWLYGGDRAGSRYYNVLRTLPDSNNVVQATDFDGRYNARFTKITAIQVNPFVKFKGLEFFGIYEIANGNNEFETPVAYKEGAFTQIGAELLYRFGNNEQFYLGGRYNTVAGKTRESQTEDFEISRFNVGGGWFISKNILTKVEYVSQSYNGDAWKGGRFEGAMFSGVVLEAAISF